MYATLASRDVDCCLIPESPFYLEGKGGLYEFIAKRLRENGHMVIVIAEGAGQDLVAESIEQQDASGNKLLKDVGLWMSLKIKVNYCQRDSVPYFHLKDKIFMWVYYSCFLLWLLLQEYFAKHNVMDITLKYIGTFVLPKFKSSYIDS
jgi:6-phosphofructokinase 1